MDVNVQLLCYDPILFGVLLGISGSLRPGVKMACFLYKYSMVVQYSGKILMLEGKGGEESRDGVRERRGRDNKQHLMTYRKLNL